MAQPPVGIDLGTTNTALAVINPAGHPEIVPNKEGARVTPSVVFYQGDGTVRVGQPALNAAESNPDRVVQRVKREMGEPDWRIEVDGKKHSAVEVSAEILKKVKSDAAATLGPITKAVITVPAYFDEVRRKATMDAAKLAGLEVLRIINEPTAAAIAYAHALDKSGRILVYDFGGGTFDVSIVDVSSKSAVEILTSKGDHRLGGSDFDDALARHYGDKLKQQVSAAVSEKGANWFKLLKTAQEDKCKLSDLDQITGIALWGTSVAQVPVSRREFDELTENLVVRTQMLVENALDEIDLRAGDIDDVLLVGGSTRIPAVVAMLEAKFGKTPVSPVNVDEAVALGAALQAGALMAHSGLIADPDVNRKMLAIAIQDVANHSYGTIALMEHHGIVERRNDIIIKKNTKLPCEITETYYTVTNRQEEVDCRVTQGEDSDPEFVNIIREGRMLLPPGLPIQSPIDVTYAYDANMRMRCTFVERTKGITQEFIVDEASNGRQFQVANAMTDADFDDLKL
jgi:molecular chaperone DnaK